MNMKYLLDPYTLLGACFLLGSDFSYRFVLEVHQPNDQLLRYTELTSQKRKETRIYIWRPQNHLPYKIMLTKYLTIIGLITEVL